MNKIIITGSEGLIGKKVSNFFLKKKKLKIVNLDRKLGHDLNSEVAVDKIFKKNKDANYLINLHGFNEHVKKNKSKSQNCKEDFLKYHLDNVFSVYLTNLKFIENCKLAKGIVNFASLFAIMSPKHYLYQEPKNIFYGNDKLVYLGVPRKLDLYYQHRKTTFTKTFPDFSEISDLWDNFWSKTSEIYDENPGNFWIFPKSRIFDKLENVFLLNGFLKFWILRNRTGPNTSFLQSKMRGTRLSYPPMRTFAEVFGKTAFTAL